MTRYLILLASIVMQMCLGATYAWSVYVTPLRALAGIGQGVAQAPFMVFYFAFPVTLLLISGVARRAKPSLLAGVGGTVFGLGWLLAALGARSFAFTVAGVGLLGGIGVGLAYVVPIAVSIRWFPKQRGLITGLSVAGFGAGAALQSNLATWLMDVRGFTPYEVFGLLGCVFLALASSAGFAMRNPPGTVTGAPECAAPDRAHREPAFRLLYVAMFAGLVGGFVVNANLKQLSANAALASGATAVATFAMANAIGRLAWGALFDRITASRVLAVNLAAQAIVLATAAALLLDNATGLLILAAGAGFNYGGVLVLYAAASSRIWGSERVATVYGRLFSSNIPAALTPFLAGVLYDRTGTFVPAILAAAAALIATAALLLCQRRRIDRGAD